MPIVVYRPSRKSHHSFIGGGPGALREVSGIAVDLPFVLPITDPVTGHASIASVGHILRMKAFNGTAVLDNWLEVQSIDTSPTGYINYTVVRRSGTAGVFPEGTAVVNYGASGDGGILLTSDASQSPYMDIFTHAGAPWTVTTPRVRVGNLDGVLGLAVQWGLAAGTDLSDTSNAARYLVASDLQFKLNNVDLTIYQSAALRVSITASGDMKLGTDVSAAATTSLDFTASTGVLRVGFLAASKGNLYFDGNALQVRLNTVVKMDVKTTGNVLIGSDTSAAASTAIVIFSATTTYNSEAGFASGDILIGDNTAAKSNLFWDQSTGRLNFRGGTTTKLYINTSGQLIAGADGVILDETGLLITDGTGSYPSLRLNSAAALDGMLKFQIATVDKTTLGFVDSATFLINTSLTRMGFVGADVHFAYSTGSSRGKAVIYNATGYGSFGFPGGTHPLEVHAGSSTIMAHITTAGLVVAKGGFYAAPDPVGSVPQNIKYSGDLISEKNGGTAYTGYVFVPLTTPLTSTSYDGNDTITVGTVTIDTSAVFSVPVGVKAVLVQVSATWAATAAASTLGLRAVGGSTNHSKLLAHDTASQDMTVVMPCDANGDFDVAVANANATNVVLRIWGYWI